MTYQEALEIYKLGNYGSELSKAEADYWLANIDTATELAFKCLEKQIPKKPKLYDGDKHQAMCPICNEDLNTHWCWGGVTYCECCGHAIDWSEEE